MSRARFAALAVAVLSALAVLAPASTADAATGRDVPVGFSGSHCYAGGKLVSVVVNVDNGGNTTIWGSKGTVHNVSPGRHTFAMQAFCKYGWVVGAGRSGTICGWVYSSGYQPRVSAFSGVYSICS